MGCGCGATKTAPMKYVHIATDGTETVKATKVEAIAMAQRVGGRWEERPK